MMYQTTRTASVVHPYHQGSTRKIADIIRPVLNFAQAIPKVSGPKVFILSTTDINKHKSCTAKLKKQIAQLARGRKA